MTALKPITDLTTVIYIPSRNVICDFIQADGLTHYGRKTFEQVQLDEKCTDAVLIPWKEAHALFEAGYRSPVAEIDEDRYWYALEVLPPCKWQGAGDSFESFHISERLAGNIVNWYMRLGHDVEGAEKARYFTLSDDSTLTRDVLRERVGAFIQAKA